MIIDASALVVGLTGAGVAEQFGTSSALAPDLIVPETLSAFWKLSRTGHKIPERSLIFDAFDNLSIEPSMRFAERAYELSGELNHPVYDCLYLAMGDILGEMLVTADQKFARKAARTRFADQVVCLR